MDEKEIGIFVNYFTKVMVVDIKLYDTLNLGDRLHFKGANTDFVQDVDSMETKGQKLEVGTQGQTVGIKVKERVRKNDKIYLVEH